MVVEVVAVFAYLLMCGMLVYLFFVVVWMFGCLVSGWFLVWFCGSLCVVV